MSNLDAITNYLSLSDRIGTAGQPTEAQFQAVADAGFETVINLAMPTSAGALPNEREIIEGLGMEAIFIPVVWDSPTVEDAIRFFETMEARRERRIFVHCGMNMRVSVFMYLYRTLREWMPHEEAAKDLHRIWEPNERWRAFIEEVRAAFSLQAQRGAERIGDVG